MLDNSNHELNEKPSTREYQPRLNDVALKFLEDLKEERERLADKFPLCIILIEEAVDRIYCTGRIPGRDYCADVYKQTPLKIVQRVLVPVKQYPKFNFTGKILGPEGNSLRRLQEETNCRIAIKGRNSIRDRAKEEQLRSSGDPRYAHLRKDLFIELSTVATPSECYARIAYALAAIRKYLVPDKNDEVSHEQLRELMEMHPETAKKSLGAYKSIFDKQFGSGVTKFLNLIKKNAGKPTEDDDVVEVPLKSIAKAKLQPKLSNVIKRTPENDQELNELAYNKFVPKFLDGVKKKAENSYESEEPDEVAYKKFVGGFPNHAYSIRRAPEHPYEADDVEEMTFEFERPAAKRVARSQYEQPKPSPTQSVIESAYFKRFQSYQADMRRLREPPVKSFKPGSYEIFNKYKNK